MISNNKFVHVPKVQRTEVRVCEVRGKILEILLLNFKLLIPRLVPEYSIRTYPFVTYRRYAIRVVFGKIP